MRIAIRNSNVKLTELLRAHVRNRVGLALGRFGDRIGHVIVKFKDLGADKHCQIDVGVRPRLVRVDDRDVDMFVAVDNASGRIARSVGRALDREAAWDGATVAPRVVKRPKR
jgi:ribosomal subunit interface protein